MLFYITLHAEGNIKELLYHADPGSVCSILVLISQTSAQDIVKLGKSIEFITFIHGEVWPVFNIIIYVSGIITNITSLF